MRNAIDNLIYALAPVPAVRRRFAVRLGIARPRVRFLPALAALPLAALVLFLTWSGWLYPLRPDSIGAIGHPFTADPLFDNAWGGPTLVGAWFVHAMAALGMQVICLALIRGLNGRPAQVAI